MEPMILGTPNTSPSTEQFLPAFLLGESFPNAPKRNKLSPEQDRRVPFGHAKSQTSANMSNGIDGHVTKSNSIKFGPPIIDLFDDMPSTYRAEKNTFASQSLFKKENASSHHSASVDAYNNSEFCLPLSSRSSYQFSNESSPNVSNLAYRSAYTTPSFTNDVYRSPPMKRPYGFSNDTTVYQTPSMSRSGQFTNYVQQDPWVVIFGFPTEFVKEVVEIFKRIGNPTDIHLKPNCNYVSIRYATQYEVQQAISLNGAQFKPGIVIGVLLSNDPDYNAKDIYSQLLPNNHNDYEAKMEKLKALSSQSQSRDNNSNVPKKSNPGGGIVNKAIEYLMRW